jgi:hypothetical protein
MRRIGGAVIVLAASWNMCASVSAGDPKAKAILDKAIKALGGEEKLAKAVSFSWKGKVTLRRDDQDGQDVDAEAIFKGIDHIHRAFGINLTIVAGERGWRKVGDRLIELSPEALASEKRSIYLQVTPVTIVPLKGSDFTCEVGGEEKVGDKVATALKITGPDGKDFTLYFDKESGLPLKERAVFEIPGGREAIAETTFSEYQDFDGIKKATKIEVKSFGFGSGFSQVITEFKILEKVRDDTFAEPK